jgi:hypothetical protein
MMFFMFALFYTLIHKHSLQLGRTDYFSTLKMEFVYVFLGTSVNFYHNTRCHVLKDNTAYRHRRCGLT